MFSAGLARPLWSLNPVGQGRHSSWHPIHHSLQGPWPMPRVFCAAPSLWELWGVQAYTCSFSGGDAARDRPIRCPAIALGPAGRKQDNKPHRNPPPPLALTHGCLRSLGENTATDVQPLAMNWGSPILGISRTSNYKDRFPQVPHMSPECQR